VAKAPAEIQLKAKGGIVYNSRGPAKIDSNRFPDAVRRARSVLPTGAEPTGPDATRWIWRLGPYVDFAYPTLIRDKGVLEQITPGEDLAGVDTGEYRASVFTGFGLNSYYIGGRKEFYESNAQGGNRFQIAFGSDFFVSRLSRTPRPADLFAFVSTASNVQGEGFREGYFYLEPPRTIAAQSSWFDFQPPTKEFVSTQSGWYGAFPIAKGRAVVNFLDGHADAVEWPELTDMRHWSPQADAPDWQLPRPGGR